MAREIIPNFDRFTDGTTRFSRIGNGSIGGKAAGLLIADSVVSRLSPASASTPLFEIPTCTVLATDLFEDFMRENDLYRLIEGEDIDDRTIALGFQRASLPPEWTGDIHTLAAHLRAPLAVRSSSLLEDSLRRPFAGVYGTKMIPNSDPDPNKRFQRLIEAIKFVYASTFFSAAKSYRRSLGIREDCEKMAVIVQAIFGKRREDRFYPCISGVARSFNFYAFEPARPEEGVVNLALGLGKTIVDGGLAYTYSPAHPKAPPPFGSIDDMLHNSQNRFWAVNMGKPPAHDPIAEAEYLEHHGLGAAEEDGCLTFLASTYDGESDRLVAGIYKPGPRVLTWAPILQDEEFPLNERIRLLLSECEAAVGSPVEIELAAELEADDRILRIALLQVRPMLVSTSKTEITDADRDLAKSLVVSNRVLGNGERSGISDIVYVRSEGFEARHTRTIATEISRLNTELVRAGRRYLLIGFGRWGSSDPWLGIPVQWSDISGAGAIVEAATSGMSPDFSQGSHFFHNLSSFEVSYFLVRQLEGQRIDWEWLGALPARTETSFVRHVETKEPVTIKVDGRSGWGVVVK